MTREEADELIDIVRASGLFDVDTARLSGAIEKAHQRYMSTRNADDISRENARRFASALLAGDAAMDWKPCGCEGCVYCNEVVLVIKESDSKLWEAITKGRST